MELEFQLSIPSKISTVKQVYQTRKIAKKKEEIRSILWYYLITTKNKPKQKGANPSMAYSITDTYKMKREILNFARNFSGVLSAPNAKFFADMTYGILASQSCLLTKISHALQEKTKKAYTVDRLSDHLKGGINVKAMSAYLNYVRKTVHFLYYRISYGIAEIIKYARVGIYDWFKPKRTDQKQLRFRLSA